MEKIIEGKYIVAARSEWTSEMIPLIASDFSGIAEQFAAYWTQENHQIFHRPTTAGVYDGKTGQLLIGYRDGERIKLR